MAIDPKSLTVDYRTLLNNTSISDRVQLAKSSAGQQLLSTLTPSQISSLFPDYYKRSNPDVSGFVEATARRYRQTAPGAPKGVAPGQEYSDLAGKSGRTAYEVGLGGLKKESRVGGRTEQATAATPTVLEKLEKVGERKIVLPAGDNLFEGKTVRQGMVDYVKAKVPDATEAGIAALLATQKGESGGRGVYDIGDGGKSYGLFQMNNFGSSKDKKGRLDALVEIMREKTGIQDPLAYIRDVRNGKIKEDPKVTARLNEACMEHIMFRDVDKSINNDRIMRGLKETDPNKAIDSITGAVRPQAYLNYGLKGVQDRINWMNQELKKGITETPVLEKKDTEVGDIKPLPEGIAKDIVTFSESLNPAQKRVFNDHIHEMVNSDKFSGDIKKFNDAFNQKQQFAGGPEAPLTGGAATRDYSLEKMNPELRARLSAVYNDPDLPPEIKNSMKIGSGFRDPNDPRVQQMYMDWLKGPKNRPMANPKHSQHGKNEGEQGAADIQGLPKDPKSVEIIKKVFEKHGLHAPVAGEGFADQGMPHVQIKPGATDPKLGGKSYAQEYAAAKEQEAASKTEQKPQPTSNQYSIDYNKAIGTIREKTPGAILYSDDALKNKINDNLTELGVKIENDKVSVTQEQIENVNKSLSGYGINAKDFIVPEAAFGTTQTVEDPNKLTAREIPTRQGTGGQEDTQLMYDGKPLVNVNKNERLSYDSNRNKLDITPKNRTRPEELADQKRQQDQRQETVFEQAQAEPAMTQRNRPTPPRTPESNFGSMVAPISHYTTDAYKRMVDVNEKFGFGDHYGYGGINT